MKKLKINNIIINVVLFFSYIFPVKASIEMMRIPLDKVLFSLFSIFILIFIKIKINIRDLVLCFFILYRILLVKDYSSIGLVSLILLEKYIEIFKKIKINFTLIVSSILIYSIFYKIPGRIIFSNIGEPNQSGFLIFNLGILAYSCNKKRISLIILFLGFLIGSRNYLLVLVAFLLINNIKKLRDIVFKFKNLKLLFLIAFCILIIMGNYFILIFEKNELSLYGATYLERIVNIKDTSNFFRLTVNNNLIKIYKENPKLLLTGIGEVDFMNRSLEIYKASGLISRAIKPHNFIFSYLRIYGLFALFIFYYISEVFKKVYTKENIAYYISIFIYAMILGISYNSYYLYLVIIVSLYLKERRSKNK